MDAEDRFAASIGEKLLELPHREGLLAKNKIKNILFHYQIQALMKASNSNNNHSFYLVQQGHQTVPLPGAFETMHVHMLQNKQ